MTNQVEIDRDVLFSVLNHLEMWRDVVEIRTGKLDPSVVRCITEISRILEVSA